MEKIILTESDLEEIIEGAVDSLREDVSYDTLANARNKSGAMYDRHVGQVGSFPSDMKNLEYLFQDNPKAKEHYDKAKNFLDRKVKQHKFFEKEVEERGRKAWFELADLLGIDKNEIADEFKYSFDIEYHPVTNSVGTAFAKLSPEEKENTLAQLSKDAQRFFTRIRLVDATTPCKEEDCDWDEYDPYEEERYYDRYDDRLYEEKVSSIVGKNLRKFLKEDEEPKVLTIELSSGPYYIWQKGIDYLGSAQNPKENYTDLNKVARFSKANGFESINDVAEYVKKNFK